MKKINPKIWVKYFVNKEFDELLMDLEKWNSELLANHIETFDEFVKTLPQCNLKIALKEFHKILFGFGLKTPKEIKNIYTITEDIIENLEEIPDFRIKEIDFLILAIQKLHEKLGIPTPYQKAWLQRSFELLDANVGIFGGLPQCSLKKFFIELYNIKLRNDKNKPTNTRDVFFILTEIQERLSEIPLKNNSNPRIWSFIRLANP